MVSLFEYMGVNAMEDIYKYLYGTFLPLYVYSALSRSVLESTNILAVQLRCVLE